MHKILITGGSGFIGTNLVEHFLDQGLKVLNLDHTEPQKKEHRAVWKKVDLLDRESLISEVRTFDPTHIVHLAARTDLNGADLEAYAVNTRGTENLVEACRECSKLQKVLFASTMLVCKVGYTPKHENDYCPTTIYGESKKLMEDFLKAGQYHYQYNIIRPTSIWGPWFRTPYRDFFDMVHRKSFINIGKRACTKTYGFVLNSVYQIRQLLFNPTKNGKVFYIGDNPPLNISEWAINIAEQMNHKKPLQLPYGLFRIGALGGDLLTKMGIAFPLTSFRLKNMTTDNIMNLDDLLEVTGPLPYSREEAIHITLKWLNYK